MKFQCDCCGMVYTIPQVDIMSEKKICCPCGEMPRKFKMIKYYVIEGESIPPHFYE